MLYSAESIKNWSVSRAFTGDTWVMARPLWCRMGRWKHAWWVLTGRCDAIWWPEDGNPYLVTGSNTGGVG